jgi:NAD+ kinase
MKVAVHGRVFSESSVPTIQEVFDELKKYDAEVIISRSYSSILRNFKIDTGSYEQYFQGDDLSSCDIIFSLGGDGTFLETLTHVGQAELPVAGINTGRLGFLASIPRDKVAEAISAIHHGNYWYDYRSMIRLESNLDIFEGLNFGLNEFTILKKDTSSMIVVHTYIDGEYLNSYWADGLIVATPTGSTGYSLSCGGPIVWPHSSNFVITPVSPHNLNIRPMIVSDNSVISFEIEGRSKNFMVSLDSRSRSVDANIQMAVQKESFRAKILQLDNYNFLDTLRQKLNWGLDVRN